MDRLILVLLIIALIIAGITYLLGRFITGIKFIKYLPGILCLLLALYYFYLATVVRGGEGFEDLGNVIMGMMLSIGAIAGLITAISIDVIRRSKKDK
ncbi:hypothetical protein Desdi_0849 [Desulfitobacterium dichloroeliminans LMG P-21439]|uniref:Uncharacterized protein n=1 Tax=Desulfitobacterium dichloroeliminans (strain LMG P-21439 / DCA1) TaxID=871963 RepID=L0F5Y1_DESDL|nr:hypothetical protein [Desulfitobacterium dichloroeliminans]AGA68373.1 hypothetical protein Desdi_0849 [Desulfitobacterium dichloroeliminans LMG P-21439]